MAIYLGSERVKISMVEEESTSSEIMESIISGTIESYYNNRVSYVGSYAFTGQVNLISADFPNCNYIGSEAFEFCINLTSVNSPNCSYIGDMAFFQCSSLITISFPNCSYIGNEVYIESAVRNISDNPQGYLDGQSWNWKGNYALELVGGWYVFISAKDYGSVINSLNIGDYVRVTGVINGISDYSDKGIVLLSTKTVSPSVEKLN